jgi:hypothetical protein
MSSANELGTGSLSPRALIFTAARTSGKKDDGLGEFSRMLDGRAHDDIRAVRIDASRAPIHVAYLQGSDRDDDVHEFLDDWSSIAHAPHALVVITAPRMSFVSPRRAAMYADWLRTNDELLRENVAGLGLVLRSALARGVFKAISSMAPLSFTHEQFKSDAEALAWAQERMHAHARAPRG